MYQTGPVHVLQPVAEASTPLLRYFKMEKTIQEKINS